MQPHWIPVVLSAAAVCSISLAGGCYVLMGFALKRKGRTTPFLTVTLNPREKFRETKVVFENYRQLQKEQNRRALLPLVLWGFVALGVVFLVLTFGSFAWLAMRAGATHPGP